MEYKCTEPVLLLLFNRPAYTRKLIEALEVVKPQNLYIVIDGPRAENHTDSENIETCFEIVKNAKWEGKKTFLKRAENYGCGKGVSEGISWFFEHVERGIILEDDCIPSPSFFGFCSTMLDRYETEQRIMHIAGTRWSEEFPIDTSYFFSRIGHIWGWATWKRAWRHYDFYMSHWESFKLSEDFNNITPDINFKKFWCITFDRFLKEKHKSTWDYQWQYTLFYNDGLAVVPKENLISNIGEQGVHSSSKQLDVHQRKVDSAFKIQNEEIEVRINRLFDSYHVRYYFQKKPPIKKRIVNKIRYLFKFF